LLIDGYDLLGFTTEFSDEREALLEPSHTLGKTWEESTWVGLKKATFEQKGYYDDAALASNAALVGKSGSSRVLCFGLATNAKRKPFTGFNGAMQVNMERVASRGALHRLNAKYLGNGQVDEGYILHEQQAETAASGNTQGTSLDNGAASTNGGVGYSQVVALTLGGYTSVTIVIQDSADNSTFADIITFANVTAAPAAERKTVAGTVRRYTAARWAFNGAGAGQSVTFMAGIARG